MRTKVLRVSFEDARYRHFVSSGGRLELLVNSKCTWKWFRVATCADAGCAQ